MSKIIKGGTVVTADLTYEAEDIYKEWATASASVVFHAVVEAAGIAE